MLRGRPKPILRLKEEDREKLELIARRPKTSQRSQITADSLLMEGTWFHTREHAHCVVEQVSAS